MKQTSRPLQREEQPVLKATLPMAIMDALPVLCFGATVWLIHLMYPSVLFTIGAVLCILAGLGKVLWKLVNAVSERNVKLLNRQFRMLMPAGLCLMMLSLLENGVQVSPETLINAVSGTPVKWLLIAGAALMVLMGLMALLLDQSAKGTNWLEQSVNLVAQLCILAAVGIMLLGHSAYPVEESADNWLVNTDKVAVTEDGKLTIFDGPGDRAALIFYPGAMVPAKAYSPLMFMLAERGMDCFLVEMPYHFAPFNGNAAGDVMASYAYSDWYLGGHSIGGLVASDYVAAHPGSAKGMLLLSAYPNKPVNEKTLRVLAVYGTEDRIHSDARYEKAMGKLASPYNQLVIEGANHASFALYGPQKGDGVATISREETWQQTVDAMISLAGLE